MAKKKVGLKNSRANSKEKVEETTLPAKTPLPKINKDEVAIKEEIDTHHPEETKPKVEKKPVVKKTTAKATRTRKVPTPPVKKGSTPPTGMKRMTFDLDKALHKKLKIKCLHDEVSMKEYIVNLIKKDMGIK